MSWCRNELPFYDSPTNTRANKRTSTPLPPPNTTVASSGVKQTQRKQPRPAEVCTQEQHRTTKRLINVPLHHFHASHLANYSRWQRLPWSHLWKYTDQDWPLAAILTPVKDLSVSVSSALDFDQSLVWNAYTADSGSTDTDTQRGVCMKPWPADVWALVHDTTFTSETFRWTRWFFIVFSLIIIISTCERAVSLFILMFVNEGFLNMF